MKKFKKNKIINIIKKAIFKLIPCIIVGVACFFIGRQIGLNTDTSSSNTTIEDVTVETRTISKTLSASGQIKEYATKKLSLDTDNKFKVLYVEEDDIVKKGQKILKYTNGEYLKAPYDLIITEINTPKSGKKVTDSHYIKVSRIDKLKVDISVNESEITSLTLNQKVEVSLTVDSTKTYTGKITKISSVGEYSSSGSTFDVEVTLKNDGSIRVGNSVSCTININELTDVIAVPINAVQISGSRKYVYLVNGENITEVDVTTGLSDDSYVEIKSGLEVGDTVRVITTTKQSTIRSTTSSRGGSGMPSFGGGDMPSMPSGGFGGFSGSDRPSGTRRGSSND